MSRAATRILVIKAGTSTLTDAAGRIDAAFIADLCAQIAAVRAAGMSPVFVSSGAIRAGVEAMSSPLTGAPTPVPFAADSLRYKQAAAAIGQGLLMHTYTEAFARVGIRCAQVLLTRDDMDDRRRFLNARSTLLALLDLGVVPIVNENDTVAVDEIKFGDNDMLAALVAAAIEAEQLIILSDVDGLYARPPSAAGFGENTLITEVARVDETVEALAGCSLSGVGTGGMRTKIEAARIASAAGISTVIARGRRAGVIPHAAGGAAVGTRFLPETGSDRLRGRKRWIAYGARPRGSVDVNSRAADTIAGGEASLLAVGITHVDGSFAPGDLIAIRDHEGSTVARGLVNYPAHEVRRIAGMKSAEFEAALGYRGYEEVVHRDNLVVDGAAAARAARKPTSKAV